MINIIKYVRYSDFTDTYCMFLQLQEDCVLSIKLAAISLMLAFTDLISFLSSGHLIRAEF